MTGVAVCRTVRQLLAMRRLPAGSATAKSMASGGTMILDTLRRSARLAARAWAHA